MASNRGNKTYNPELFDLYRQSNQAAADDLFGPSEPVPAPQPVSEPAPAPVPQPTAETVTASPQVDVRKPETVAQPSMEPEPARATKPSAGIPLSQRNPDGRRIMGDEPVKTPVEPEVTAEPKHETVPEESAKEADPLDAAVEDVISTQAPVQEAPKTIYRPPLADDISMDERPSDIGNTMGQRPMGTPAFGQEANPQQRVVPNPAMGSATFGYGQNIQEQPAYSYESLLKPQTNFKTFGQKTISVHSPKGGVGKSTVAKELSWAYALGEVNEQKLKVLLVDVDWEFGDQAMLFNVDPNPNISHWAKRIAKDQARDYEAWKKEGHRAEEKYERKMPRYDKMTIKSYVLSITENLDLLAAPKSPLDKNLITPEIMQVIIANLKLSDYDVVIYDNTNTIADPRTYVTLEASDRIFLIDTLDMTTISEIASMLQTMREKSFDLSKISLVINNVPKDIKEQDITPDQVVDAFELNYSTQIPDTRRIRINNNAGEAAMFARKDNPYTKAIKHMANEVLPVYPEKKKGIFGKLFKK